MLNKNLNKSNQLNQNNKIKEDKVMERREEIRTKIEELINKIKEEEKELKYFDDNLIFKDYTKNRIYTNYNFDNIYDMIMEWANNKFIYYSEADEFLENYDIFEEIKNMQFEYGFTPDNQCQLASFILERETMDRDYSTLEDIQDKIGKIEELQEELDEIEEEIEPVEEVER